MLLLLLILSANPVKAQADAAFRAKKYAVACPLYERLASRGRDAWAWNDLALCELKLGDLPKSLAALRTVAKLEAAIPEAKLHDAWAFNLKLLANAVVDCPSAECASVALAVAREPAAPDVLRRSLFIRAASLLGEEDLQRLPTMDFSYGAVGPFDACAEVKTLGGCSTQILFCTRQEPRSEESVPESSVVRGYLIDRSDQEAWGSAPLPSESHLEFSVQGETGTRCPIYDDEGHFMGRPPDEDSHSVDVLEADGCSGLATIVTVDHLACSPRSSASVSTLSFSVWRPDSPDAGH